MQKIAMMRGDSSVSPRFATQAEGPEYKSPALMSETGYGGMGL